MFHALYFGLLFTLECSALINPVQLCTFSDGRKIYNLNSLAGAKDYELKTPGNPNITLNICKPVISEPWHLNDVDQTDNIGGFARKSRGDFSMGVANSTITLVEDPESELPMLRLSFSQGSKCPGSDTSRGSAVLNFICSADSVQTQPKLIAQLPDDDEEACYWVFEWKTKAACAISAGRGIGGFFVTLLSTVILLALLYLILGTLYNRYILKLTGPAQIPQFSLESAKYHFTQFLFLIMDWFEKVQSRTSAPPRGQQTNPVSHHAQSSAPQNDNAPPPAEDGFGFVRPMPKSTPSAGRTNPVSHQTSVIAAQKKINEPGTREEREFMLGSDTDDDEDEYGQRTPVAAAAPPVAPPAAPPVVPPAAPPAEPRAQPPAEQDGVELRGRAAEDGEILRL